MKNFNELRKNLRKDFSGLPKIKLAIVADWSVQMLIQAVRGLGYSEGYDIDVYEAAFDQMEAELYDETSSLYSFQPDFIVIFPSAEKLQNRFYRGNVRDGKAFAQREMDRFHALWEAAARYSNAEILFSNYCEIEDGVYGNYAAIYPESFLVALRYLNILVSEAAAVRRDLHIIDMSALQNRYGRRTFFDDRLYYLTKTICSMEVLPAVAGEIISVIRTLKGKLRKCIITDLDNTLWGGVVGDDGLEGIQLGELGIGKAFTDLQLWLKELSRRGIALAVCSKNDEDKAKEPFEKHPDMVLCMEDISVFRANWENKAENIREICESLNLGIDSVVFLDDSPFERELVRNILPDITVPELPADPSLYLSFLQRLNLFETVSISAEDRERSKLYREEAKRNELLLGGISFEEYLKSLNMIAEVKPFDSYSIPRVAQLTQRSNQFNLRTIRYSEQEILRISEDIENYATFGLRLEDKFGDYGLIGVAIIKQIDSETWFIDTLIMSCRVLKRGVEEFLINEIVKMAERKGVRFITGEYRPTAKNRMVSDLLKAFGFIPIDKGQFRLAVNDYSPRPTYISYDLAKEERH